jgi:hypothetical protein
METVRPNTITNTITKDTNWLRVRLVLIVDIPVCALIKQDSFRRKDIPTKGRLTYVKSKSRLLLELQTKNSENWKKCFETTVTLPDSPYLGFTAATGDVSDNHEWVFHRRVRRSSADMPALLPSTRTLSF